MSTTKRKILNIVGARPNFMKIAPILEAMQRYPDQLSPMLVHTGQHYDEKMSKLFFVDLGLPQPDIYMGVGSGSHAEQTARIMIEFEKVILKETPDLVLVVGDVNSTIACALTAVKMGIPVAHVEAGLRSFDRSMPEEINRILTDQISDYLFITEKSAEENLLREGKSADQIYFTGNVMIDSLLKNKAKAERSTILSELGVGPGQFALVTMHRPSNVDQPEKLREILSILMTISTSLKVVFPIHPRTRKNIGSFVPGNVILTDPLGYLDFLKLMSEAKLVLTDSGGIQEETTVLGVPCLTMREQTERPVTIEQGTNILVGLDQNVILRHVGEILDGRAKQGRVPEKWDGKAAERIVEVLVA